MPTVHLDPKPHLALRSKGWQFIGVYETNNTPERFLSNFIANSCEVRETQFDDMGNTVHADSFALWVNPCGLAPCGCVEHAEEGWPCPHDLAKFEELKKKILG